MYFVKISSAKMPNNCWGRYAHIALIYSADGTPPKQIKNTKNNKVIYQDGPLHVGSTTRSAFVRKQSWYLKKCEELNAAPEQH